MTSQLQQIIIDNFQQLPQVNTAYLHGSTATGNSDPSSDIDLAVIGDDISLKQLISLKQRLSDSLQKKLTWLISLTPPTLISLTGSSTKANG